MGLRSGLSTARAWLVHALTASGAVLALLALIAVIEREWDEALGWLLAALALDGVDGTLARKARVKTTLPRIDGEMLDLITDYLTYVLVPAVLIWRAALVPASLAPWLAALVLVSSLYCFTRRDLKTEDHYFRGFPALWNIVALYLFISRPDQVVSAVVVLLFAALTFAPVHFVHPFRVRDYGRWLPLLALAWAAATAGLLWPGWSADEQSILLASSLALAASLVALGLRRSLRGASGASVAEPERPLDPL
jgi:phosphatidylcholine synthase